MSEAAFWQTLGKNMKRKKCWRQATRHEDKLQKGIADVSFVSNSGAHGWIELKKLHEWPVRESTIVRIPHYKEEQKIWLTEKAEAGGNVWVLIKINRDVILFGWRVVPYLGMMNRNEMLSRAAGFWPGKTDYYELGKLLAMGN